MSEASGRPRSAEVTQAILHAAHALLHETGFEGMSIEAVAARAGVGKTTIYRRYATKEDLAVAAISSHVESAALPDTGHARTDLVAFYAQLARNVGNAGGMRLMGTLLVEAERSPAFVAACKGAITQARLRQLRTLVDRGIERGQLRPDADYPMLGQMLFGGLIARFVADPPVPADYAEQAVAAIWGTIAAPAASDPRSTATTAPD